MIKKFKAIDLSEQKEIEFTFDNIYGYEGEVGGVILPDGDTALNYNNGYGNDGMNLDLVIIQYVGLIDTNNVELYEYDKVLVEDGADKKEYYVKWSLNMELILVKNLSDEDGLLLTKEIDRVSKIGNAYLDGVNW